MVVACGAEGGTGTPGRASGIVVPCGADGGIGGTGIPGAGGGTGA